jgi:hypothetical protein
MPKIENTQSSAIRLSLVVTLAGILLAAGCSSASENTGTSSQATPSAAGQPSAGGTTPTQKGGGNSSRGGGQGGSVGTFTVAFAKCMRSHGIPNFPDPNGRPGQLGPSSGIDPGSAKFRAALNGPCEKLAPPAWVDSGKGSVPGGGGS